MDTAPIKNIILYLSLSPGSLILAETEDGAFRLFHNDLPLAPPWLPHQRNAAIVAWYEAKARIASLPFS